MNDEMIPGKLYRYVGRGGTVSEVSVTPALRSGRLFACAPHHSYRKIYTDRAATPACDEQALYFVEVEDEASDGVTQRQAYETMHRECGLQVGDTVRVLRWPKKGEWGWPGEPPVEDHAAGFCGKIVDVGSVSLTVVSEGYEYELPFFVLETVNKVVRVKMSDDVEALLADDGSYAVIDGVEYSLHSLLGLARAMDRIRRDWVTNQ